MRHLASGLLALLVAGAVEAQDSLRITPTFSWRLRGESWDWFDGGPEGRYAFVGSHARAGANLARRTLEVRLEAASPALLGLPDDAVLPAPAGQLGLGGTYAAVNGGRRDVAGLFVKQASVRLGAAPGRQGRSLRVGRFEFADGAEYTPSDAALAQLRAQRATQRMIGPFGFTHGQRSFDGALVQRHGERGQITLTAFRPTRGVFDVDGAGSLPVDVVYLAWNHERGMGRTPVDRRLFVMHVADRRGTVPTDARPLGVRQAAPRGIGVTTVGGHRARRYGTGAMQGDVLVWGAYQFGRWGGLDHRAYALAAEGTLRLGGIAGRPALRVGAARGSGDADPADGRHTTFHQVLPTPRAYARFPFHNLMNVEEAFAGLELRPHARVTLRSSAHALRLREGADLWYLGGGAFDRQTFGFVGRPANGERWLGRMVEFSGEWRPSTRIQFELFAAHASGGPVTAQSYGSVRPARLLYFETTVRR